MNFCAVYPEKLGRTRFAIQNNSALCNLLYLIGFSLTFILMAREDRSHGMITLSAFAIKHKNIITINIFYPFTTANKKNKPCHSLAGVCRAL